MRSIYDRCGKGQRTTLHEVPATTRHCLDLGCEIALERRYDHEALDRSAVDIVETAKRTGAKVAGPVPLPTRRERYTVLRSPHIDKKSREQFEIATHKRILYITEPTPKFIDAINRLNIPAGVYIRIKA
jgi:small subunit ribosomal protein S10